MSTSTALMPLDPAVSPEQAMRVLPIRANLLPPEITSGRNARRTRVLLIGAVVLVAVVMGAWYLLADRQRDLAADDLASVTDQVDRTRQSIKNNKEYAAVTKVIKERDEIDADLKTVTAKDLPWYTLVDGLRAAAAKKGGTITDVTAILAEDTAAAAGTATAGTVGTLQIEGTAKDKAAVADVLDALSGVDGVTNVYLTATSQSVKSWGFTLSAAVKSDYVCGRFSAKTCGSK